MLIDSNCPFSKGRFAAALREFWKLEAVKFEAFPKATRTKRHKLAFNKLHVFGLDVRHVLFLDLDIFVRSENILDLFSVQAPAGLLHGDVNGELEHGATIDSQLFAKNFCCINAGVLRLDPPDSKDSRKKQCTYLFRKAASINEPTYLPEQHFLASELQGWRNLGVQFNWEVGPCIEITDSGVREYKLGTWANLKLDDIVVFHFSGMQLKPHEYLHFDEAELRVQLRHDWNWRDRYSRIATAISEWCGSARKFRETYQNSSFADVVEKCLPWERVLPQSRECRWCRQRTLVSTYTDWCANCSFLWHCQGWQPRPVNFQGRWLDVGSEHGITARIEGSVVKYCEWRGEFSFSGSSVKIVWHEDDRCNVGTARGQAILWDNGQGWAFLGAFLVH